MSSRFSNYMYFFVFVFTSWIDMTFLHSNLTILCDSAFYTAVQGFENKMYARKGSMSCENLISDNLNSENCTKK